MLCSERLSTGFRTQAQTEISALQKRQKCTSVCQSRHRTAILKIQTSKLRLLSESKTATDTAAGLCLFYRLELFSNRLRSIFNAFVSILLTYEREILRIFATFFCVIGSLPLSP